MGEVIASWMFAAVHLCFRIARSSLVLGIRKEMSAGIFFFFKVNTQVAGLNKEKFRLLNKVPILLTRSRYLQQVLWSRK